MLDEINIDFFWKGGGGSSLNKCNQLENLKQDDVKNKNLKEESFNHFSSNCLQRNQIRIPSLLANEFQDWFPQTLKLIIPLPSGC